MATSDRLLKKKKKTSGSRNLVCKNFWKLQGRTNLCMACASAKPKKRPISEHPTSSCTKSWSERHHISTDYGNTRPGSELKQDRCRDLPLQARSKGADCAKKVSRQSHI